MGTETTEVHLEANNVQSSSAIIDQKNQEHLRYESHRLATFANWPRHAKVEATKIAKAGFYYTGSYLEVKCHWCGCCLSTWEFGDQVMSRHRRANPECSFVTNSSNNVPMTSTSQPEASTDSTDTVGNIAQESSQSAVAEEESFNENAEESGTRSDQPVDTEESSSTTLTNDFSEASSSGQSSGQLFSIYQHEEERLLTFTDWPVSFISPEDLAKAGFFFTRINDCVRCAFCLGYVGSWDQGDEPASVHRDIYPNCDFMLGRDVGNIPMSDERRLHLQQDQRFNMSEVTSMDSSSPALGMDVAGSNIDVGYDETGIRPRRTVDMNSFPEKGKSALTVRDTSLADDVSMMGVIRHQGPAHAKYATLDARLRSFRDWPPALRQQPQELSEAGFYYIGLSDQVKCFYCDGGLRNWQPEDNPWVEHSRWFSKCGFVRLLKGDEFIAECIASKPPEDMPELPPSTSGGASRDFAELKEETLHAMMNSSIVAEALSLGIDPARVRMALRKKWAATGSGYGDSQQLLSAAMKFQHNQEERVKLENTVTHSPFENFTSLPVGEKTSTQDESKASKETDEAATKQEPSGAATEVTVNPLDLERENRRLKEERTCKICMDKEIGVVFLPCGHLISCLTCAPALTTCPLCRQPINGTVKTYMS